MTTPERESAYAELRREVDTLLPYRDELLKIADDIGEPDDPFAAWEAIQAMRDRIAELEKGLGGTLNLAVSAVSYAMRGTADPEQTEKYGKTLADLAAARSLLNGDKDGQ